ncbi:cupin domain-containing protein [Enterovibrio sp. ZSDZ35]|uniref:Cupin domain-containing protein n=1 Tax=Enterovibrio qingdaonensis TaxID=2899818 RepID=A0ABT5QTX9_9GAMM|nr:cupin domain-containing protein [Enterovibrio sp. ZSDZ35]MDD1784431.1 cupin domain-containing protein [Enterovibrio sp. ZSDZ35]
MPSTKLASQTYIEMNVDFSTPVLIKGGDNTYGPTPMAGVERMMFERRGDEIARRATSCVRYAPGSSFKPHSHPGGEEYIVLQGTFSDENGDFSQGMYVRNPVGSTHAPLTKEGCEIFVKLSQLPSTEPDYFYLNTKETEWTSVNEHHKTLPLWNSDLEETALHQFKAGFESAEEIFNKVVEIFVLSGRANINGSGYEKYSWMRFPPATPITITTESGTVVYRKIGLGEVRL